MTLVALLASFIPALGRLEQIRLASEVNRCQPPTPTSNSQLKSFEDSFPWELGVDVSAP